MDPTQKVYDAIERRYGFALPQEYRDMQARGWFNYVDRTNPYFEPGSQSYLWLDDMEWLPPEKILSHQFPNYCKSGFVPFAFAAGGNHWCWYTEHSVDGITPVVECPRDSNVGEFYAPHFLGALYRQAIAYATNLDPQREDLSRQHLKRWAHDLGPLLPAEWRATLAALHAAPLLSWKSKYMNDCTEFGLLDPDEYNAIVRRDLAFPKLDEKFKWMID